MARQMIRMTKLPLEGIRVIDTSYVFAGPYAFASWAISAPM